ncbi:MAG: circularly permuted type 2 ATP-grasp protein, partial [Sphingomonadales bacterium]|nr:circularly permuted type 2 ATP-grasp protein [Sphingomonadales bacterium]
MTHSPSSFDEMFATDGAVRTAYTGYGEWYGEQDQAALRRKGQEAEGVFRRTGITFNVYGDNAGEERLIPFDMVPRIVTAQEWRKLSRGIEQRVRALNAFLH